MIKKLSLNNILTFGKYKNKTIKEIIDEDCMYIDWLKDEQIIHLDADALIYLINERTIFEIKSNKLNYQKEKEIRYNKRNLKKEVNE